MIVSGSLERSATTRRPARRARAPRVAPPRLERRRDVGAWRARPLMLSGPCTDTWNAARAGSSSGAFANLKRLGKYQLVGIAAKQPAKRPAEETPADTERIQQQSDQ